MAWSSRLVCPCSKNRGDGASAGAESDRERVVLLGVVLASSSVSSWDRNISSPPSSLSFILIAIQVPVTAAV